MIKKNTHLFSDCGTVYNLENGNVDFVEVEVTYKQKANITCNDGYYYTTHEHIECQSDGKWSEVECRHGKSWSTTTRHISNAKVMGNGVRLSADMVSHGLLLHDTYRMPK